MADIAGQEKFEFFTAKVLLQDIAKGQTLVGSDPAGLQIAKIARQAEQIGFAYQGKECVEVFGFFGKFQFQLVQISIEIRRDGKPGTVRKVEAIDGIHFHPLRSDAQILEQSAADGGRIAEQRVEMRGRVEGELLAAKGAAVTTNHEMLFNQQHLESGTRQQVGADQPAYSGADHDCVVGIIRRLFQSAKSSSQARYS